MGTKNNPSKHDCYSKAHPDEPFFVLLARDPLAPDLVRRWASLREAAGEDPEKVREARDCAAAMEGFLRFVPVDALYSTYVGGVAIGAWSTLTEAKAAVRKYLAASAPAEPRLCLCGLSGEPCLSLDGKFCETHEDGDDVALTVDNFNKMLSEARKTYPLQPLLRDRQTHWDPSSRLTALFFSNEMGGEAGEAVEALLSLVVASGKAQNAVKKLEREDLGLPGSRSTVEAAAAELADVVISAANLANALGFDLFGMEVPKKFDEASIKVGLPTRWRW